MTAAAILRQTAESHGITVAALRSADRRQSLFLARVVAANRLRSERKLTGGQIAQLLNRSTYQTKYYLDAKHRNARREICRKRNAAGRAAG
jgi:chromosomal replication initiation ATPase DnaA